MRLGALRSVVRRASCGFVFGVTLFVACTMTAVGAEPEVPKITEFPRLQKLKKLYPSTVLVRGGQPASAIVTPQGERYAALAARLQGAVREATGASLPVRLDSTLVRDWRLDTAAIGDRTLIAIGNVNTNTLLGWLYGEFYCVEDSIYPGEGGYVVRTAHDPFATGVNVLGLSGSDAAGVERAIDAFVAHYVRKGAELTLPQPVVEVSMKSREYSFLPEGRASPEYENKREPPYQTVEYHRGALKKAGLMDNEGRVVTKPDATVDIVGRAIFDIGWTWFRRGDAALPPLMKEVFDKNRRPFEEWDKITGSLSLYCCWDLIEELPVWTDEDRLLFSNALLRIAAAGEERRNMHAQVLDGAVQTMDENHGTASAVRSFMAWQYFDKYYNRPEGKYWMRLAKAAFDGQASTFEIAEDGAGYLDFNPDNMMDYGIRMRDRTCFDRGVAMHNARYSALACINNLGLSTGFGDSPGLIAATGFNHIARAAWVYRDPRLTWIILNVFPHPSGINVFRRNLVFDFDVKPVRPDEWTGVINVPMYVKTLTKGEGRKEIIWDPKEIVDPELFSKIVFKENWSATGQYLLLDGTEGVKRNGRMIGPQGHGHRDANTLIDFASHGRMWLVDHTYSGGAGLNHSGVEVTMNGRPSPLLNGEVKLRGILDAPGVGMTRTLQGGHERVIVWRKGGWVAVLDRVTADKDGEYFARATLKTLGDAAQEGTALQLTQKGVFCRVLTDGEGQLTIDARTDQSREAFTNFYPYANPDPRYFRQDKLRSLKAGESLHFATVLYPYAKAEASAAVRLMPVSEGVALVRDGGARYLVSDGTDAGAPVSVVSGDGAWALNATAIGGGLLKCDGPCDLGVETERGTLTVRTLQARRVTLNPAPARVLLVRKGDALETKDGTVETAAPNTPAPLRREGAAAVLDLAAGSYILALQEWPGFGQMARQNAAELDAAERTAASHAQAREKQRAQTEARGFAIETIMLDMAVNTLQLADLDGDGAAEWIAGGATGVRAYRPNGERLWAFDTQKPVRALAVGDVNGDGRPDIAAGCDDERVYLLDARGKLAWSFQCKPSKSELAGPPAVNAVWIADLEGDGAMEVIAGANQFHVLSREGKLKWEVYARKHAGTVWGDFVQGDVADLIGDGRKECMVVYDDSYPFMVVYDPKGEKMKGGRPGVWNYYLWPTCAVRAVDLFGGQKKKVIVVATAAALCGYWPGVEGEEAEAFTTTGAFTGMTVFQPDAAKGATLFTSGEMTEIQSWSDWRLGEDGRHLPWPKHWARTLGESASAMQAIRFTKPARDVLLVGAEAGDVFALNAADGKPLARAALGGARVVQIIDARNDAALAVKADGTVVRMRLNADAVAR